MGRRTGLAVLLYGIASVAYVIDRVTKLLAERLLAGRPPVVLVPGVVQLDYTTNAGGAFGLFGGLPWLFFAATLVVCAVIALASRKLESALSAVGLGFILGGALGNLTDRVVNGPGLSGRVVDFVDLHVWPVFNAADSAIVVGAVLVVLASVREGRRQEPAASASG